ncbi:hypothetical protein VTN49DRAFT_3083 [Thermomyces lanuginosus]|uniref:uncharacterized protein n=1 Tax=Thermomyces lanuginosus TaxID=5541 RepID=UPI003742110B
MDMNHLIGQRFNLISKSDIRYVGTLHEINPEASTIALENVVSYGTEGRRGNPAEEIPPSSSVYEYIVFRGSDVKDISLAEEEKKEEPPRPQMPNDPAILGSMSRPGPGPQVSQPQATRPPPGYPQQQPPYSSFYPPYGQRYGPPGYPSGAPGFPPYSAAPGWYPPPGPYPQGAPGFPQSQGPIGPPHGQLDHQAPASVAPAVTTQTSELPASDKPTTTKSTTPAPTAAPAPTSTTESKPSVAEVTQGASPAATQAPAPATSASQAPPPSAPTGPKADRFIPAIPISTPDAKASVPTTTVATSQSTAQAAITDATRAATAAVAAAMAKLPQPNTQKKSTADGAVDSMTKKFSEMKTHDNRGHRDGHQAPRGRWSHRGGHYSQPKTVEVPDTEFDFESANAKFNKQDLVKEAVATGSPIVEDGKAVNGTSGDSSKPTIPVGYNKAASFFDNISSEIRDREEGIVRRERRSDEERKNIETFGQGSVDGFRGSYRSRGRGRGYGGRGRGYNRGYGNRGRGGYRSGTGVYAQT